MVLTLYSQNILFSGLEGLIYLLALVTNVYIEELGHHWFRQCLLHQAIMKTNVLSVVDTIEQHLVGISTSFRCWHSRKHPNWWAMILAPAWPLDDIFNVNGHNIDPDFYSVSMGPVLWMSNYIFIQLWYVIIHPGLLKINVVIAQLPSWSYDMDKSLHPTENHGMYYLSMS